MRGQLAIYQDLGLRRESVEAAFAVMKLEPPRTVQPQVLLFTGHRIDPPGRPTPRFPPEKEVVAREAIERAVARELERPESGAVGFAGGASGGDILFHEVCDELGIATTLYLALERDRYLEKRFRTEGRSGYDASTISTRSCRAGSSPPPRSFPGG